MRVFRVCMCACVRVCCHTGSIATNQLTKYLKSFRDSPYNARKSGHCHERSEKYCFAAPTIWLWNPWPAQGALGQFHNTTLSKTTDHVPVEVMAALWSFQNLWKGSLGQAMSWTLTTETEIHKQKMHILIRFTKPADVQGTRA